MLAVEVEFLLYIEPARAISQCSRSARYSRVFVYSVLGVLEYLCLPVGTPSSYQVLEYSEYRVTRRIW